MVVTLRPATSSTFVTHGLNGLPSRWLVQALQTSMPQPYFGPVTPELVAQRPQRRQVGGSVDRDLLAVEHERVGRHQDSCEVAGRVDPVPLGKGVKSTGKTIGKLRGLVPVARA